jgi:hypothetical protein
MTIRETEIIAVGAEEPAASSVSWAAVIAGALAAVSTTLILMLVGSGLGLTMVSPWANAGATATTFAVSSIIWLVVVQWLSSAMGGYLSGRLRTRWSGIQGDEVTFRDTAHGFLAWALATLIMAALLTSAVTAIVGGAVQTAATVTSGAAQGAAEGAAQSAGPAGRSAADPTAYFVDTLFRAAPSPQGATTGAAPAQVGAPGRDVRGEATRILVNSLGSDQMAAADKTYLAQLVSSETGLSPPDAEARVNEVLTQVQSATAKAKVLADQARKASATLAILMALSLAIGAFIASVAAVLGGKVRDAP